MPQPSPSITSKRPLAIAGRRGRWPAAVISVLLHGVIIAVLLTAGKRGAPPAPQDMGTIELVPIESEGHRTAARPAQAQAEPAQMEPAKTEQAKTEPAQTEQPKAEPARIKPSSAAPAKTAAEQPPAAGQPAVQSPASAGPPPGQMAALAASPADKPQAAKPEAAKPQATKPQAAKPQAPPPPAQPPAPAPEAKAPTFDFSGDESDANAITFGEHVVPASLDARFRNRPPRYPHEAAVRGEAGTVLLLIHVAANGETASAEVAQSSGYPALDSAAVAAARSWHFHPAIRDGQAVPFDMPFRFVFQPE